MGDTYKFSIMGALLECFIEFPLFGDDYPALRQTALSGRFRRIGANG